ncbi:MAG: hypothetical protein HQM09_19825 [Candidatus Riflebacteria bacterium]|nr:hypothetical protein [Candidatus Riflebacteria bacterium]
MPSINSGLTMFLAVMVVLVMSGGATIPKMPFHHQKIAWKMADVPLNNSGDTTIQLKILGERAEKVRLYKELFDGYELGCMDFVDNSGIRSRVEKCWKNMLIDAAEIRWPDGECWAFFAWDCEAADRLRVLSLFDPRSRELTSCELQFDKTGKDDQPRVVSHRHSWNLSLPKNKKYLDFLDSVMIGYADSSTLCSETHGLKLLRSGNVASVTFVFSRERALVDTLPKL